MSRPASQHRLSVGSNASSLPARNSYTRTHSHSASLASVSTANRINRRKSSTFSPATRPSINGAVIENAVAEGSAVQRRSSTSKAALASLNDGLPSMPSSLPQHASVPENVALSSSAVVDGPSLSSFHGIEKSKSKMRRASDGTRLTKKEKAAAGELKCEHCGKAYKHGSCLNKHLWEHTPQWQYTSKLLISKHQQVQLLEAASVLVAMNQDGSAANDSDNSSSPAASGSSDMRDGDEELSSTETTPPPHSEEPYRDNKRFSNNSSIYSRSYQSVFSSGSMPNAEPDANIYRWSASSNSRPATANTSIAESYHGDEDPQDLAAAVGLLSCSYGTPRSGPTAMPDVPPVPPLPAKYQNQGYSNFRNQGEDVDMDDDDDSLDDEPHGRHDDTELGMFGKMD
ncbi:uncharacterized protein MYCFIDRAFT_85891 [Pseudocercospora fijiensis CIRAD86]|uniref:C2H2-type domain-containing protein n=1 Tax=Pseudocercospora fijiensis (strain CIRAD86) TaxID=383855 RepID=N1Q6F2_PSEFD|nr:uncharacterized protein MYCFIDRAFT_85891 [Pseudocercospora fijiensis CIRAD86]EME87930.1 hypothetical protein MYCFIDRAFT_85891 [Pseudocercospora fijiensis CIRAD86]